MSEFIHVYELRCRRCMGELAGMPTDKVFTCAACNVAFFPSDGALNAVPLHWALAPDENVVPMYLPFWKMDVDVSVTAPNGNPVTRETAARNISAVWVAAFYENRPSYFGNPGLNLTIVRAAPSVAAARPPSAEVKGIIRSVDDAKRYATLFVTQILDKEKDVTGYGIDVSFRAAALWAMPFEYREAEDILVDLISGSTYQSAVVQYFKEMIMR
ncbi:MAG: hypothetical protein JXX29_12455 [Deltaproteobacteria bacterium]|nr:hypothetical protein [Deltaproteobacteria bacterium]MBN2672486.1 hypothetical protein [Deltaproteobacteria bacterium]